MTIRYAIDTSGPLHKFVRLETPRPPPPSPSPSDARSWAQRKRDFVREMRARVALHARLFPAALDALPALKRKDPTAPLVTPAQLRLARTEAGLSQRALATAQCCSRSLVAEAERGRRTPLPAVAWWTWRTLEARARRLADPVAAAAEAPR